MAQQIPIQYRVNAQDELVFVNDAWQTFALTNGGNGLEAENVLQRPLFDFITDETTRLLYRNLLQHVRDGHPVRFPFRCDAPAHRRWQEMTMALTEGGLVEFTTYLLHSEEHSPIPLLANTLPQSATLLRLCSWCKRAQVEAAEWIELEEAVLRFHLFEQAPLPQVSHGICNTCFASMKKRLSTVQNDHARGSHAGRC